MVRIKDHKRGWLDGRQFDMWPHFEEHIGWTVVTAGPVDLELEGSTPNYNDGRIKVLPPDYPMILKDVDNRGYAYGYNHETGVLRMPVEVLKPWSR